MTTAERPVDRDLNRQRQAEIYGAPLGDRIRRITATLGITQNRLAATLGMSPAMLSQLASARRVKIGDPAALSRFLLLDARCAAGPVPRTAVVALLDRARATGLSLQATAGRSALGPGAEGARPARRPDAGTAAAEALRAVVDPARLVAAAATLGSSFPELAALLRQAASGPR